MRILKEPQPQLLEIVVPTDGKNRRLNVGFIFYK